MNDLELIQSVIRELDSINIPVALFQQIGVPLFNANGKLKVLLKAILERQPKEQTEQKEPAEHPDEKVE